MGTLLLLPHRSQALITLTVAGWRRQAGGGRAPALSHAIHSLSPQSTAQCFLKYHRFQIIFYRSEAAQELVSLVFLKLTTHCNYVGFDILGAHEVLALLLMTSHIL